MESFWKTLLFSTTDTSRLASLLDVLGYQTSANLHNAIQTSITHHITHKLSPSLYHESISFANLVFNLWRYYIDTIRIMGYEALVGGIGGGLSRGLYGGLGTCGASAIILIIEELLDLKKWKELSFFQVPFWDLSFVEYVNNDDDGEEELLGDEEEEEDMYEFASSGRRRHTRRRRRIPSTLTAYIKAFLTDWFHVIYHHWKETYSFELGVLKWCIYFVGMSLSILLASLYTNVILLSIHSVITYGVEYLRLCIGIFFAVAVFLWWHADGGTVVTGLDELSLELEMGGLSSGLESTRDVGPSVFVTPSHHDQLMGRSLPLSPLVDFDGGDGVRRGRSVSGRTTGGGGGGYVSAGGHTASRLSASLSAAAARHVSSPSPTPAATPSNHVPTTTSLPRFPLGTIPASIMPTKPSSPGEILPHLSVVILCYSIGYLTNFIFVFPLTSTLWAAFVTICVYSHMCRGVMYNVLYYFYSWWREWKDFQAEQLYREGFHMVEEDDPEVYGGQIGGGDGDELG